LDDGSNFGLELHSCLSCNIDALIAFQSSKHDILHRKQAEICKRYGLSPNPYVVPGLEEADHHELTDLLEAFTELRKDLKKLQWYNRVNQEAIDRVYGKLRKYSSFIDRPYENHQAKWLDSQLASESQCLKDAERLDELVADIERVCSNAQSAADGTSLCLKSICDQQSPSLVYPTAAYRAIRGDQPSILAKALEWKAPRNSAPRSQLQPSLCALFDLSITCQARRCAGFLLSEELPNNDVVFDHNCLNRLITTTGRSTTTTDRDDPGSAAREVIDQSNREITTDLFLQILDQLGPKQKVVLEAQDALGRLPLHYAALYGLTAICQSILKSLQDCGQGSSAALDAILSADAEGYTPIQLAVGRGHTTVAELFLGVLEPSCQTVDESRGQHLRSVLGGLLFVVLRSQYDVLVQLFASSHIDINHQSTRGQTALYIAAQIGREDYMEMLLKSTPGRNASIDIAETAYGWTPLFVACVEGHLAVVKLLLKAGASQQIVDYKGWTAKEHAAFRGHLAVAERLELCRTEDPTNGPASVTFMTAKNATHQLRSDYSHVIVNLGVVQKGKQAEAVALDCYSSKEAPGPHTDTRFSIEVSAPGELGSSQLVQLPILNDMINEPYVFPVMDFRKAQLTFNIFCASAVSGRKGILVGSGTVLLESQKHCYGADRESLIREHTVPILKRATLDLMGTITFTYVIAKPCTKLNLPSTTQSCLNEVDSVQLVGHRGMFSFQVTDSAVELY
jgi:glycerophosphodiester phosphodiesterase